MQLSKGGFRAVGIGAALLALTACSDGMDFDLRSLGNGFDTSEAVRNGVTARPAPDDRGVISYPTYQVAVARRGDTVTDVANRVGLPAQEIASFNGLPTDVALREGEILALPRRVAEPSAATGAVDVAAIATTAIDRSSGAASTTTTAVTQSGEEPIRHQVARGETAFTIARLYSVSVKALGDWNGLGPDLTVREGQYLLIPVATEPDPEPEPVSAPGSGSPTPTPPSAARPLPAPETREAAAAPASPALSTERTTASASRLAMPVSGSIIRPYEKGKSEGIGIAASAGTTVNAAGDGTVAAITRDTEGVPILVIRHEGNLLTVYANVGDLTVDKGDAVTRGQKIAEVREGSPSFLHFEVRQGFESVDPMPFLQ